MAVYTFYPTQADGLAPTFQVFDQPDDDAALVRAGQVLDEHASAAVVVIWEGGRQVAQRRRTHEAA